MAANEDLLGLLHEATAASLMEKLKGTPILDEAGEVIGTIPPSAADIQAAAKFLKDNNITCAPSSDNKMGELEASLATKSERRRARNTVTPFDLADATAEAPFSLSKGLN